MLLRVGYYDVGRVDLQGGNSRPPWKSPPGAAAKLRQWEFGSSMYAKYLGSGCGLKLGRQLDWRLRCIWDGVVRVIDGTSGSHCDQGLLGTWVLSAGLEQDADVMLCRKFGSNRSLLDGSLVYGGPWSQCVKKRGVVRGVEEASLVCTLTHLLVTYPECTSGRSAGSC